LSPLLFDNLFSIRPDVLSASELVLQMHVDIFKALHGLCRRRYQA